ncbi:MAG: cysteine hydrolase family protein [Alphaproteobacteria bacterium]
MTLTTLRNMVGLPAGAPPLSQSALVMIDCQNTYRDGVMRLVGVEPALDEARRVLERARAAGTPVLHIVHDAGPGSPYDVRAEIGQIADKVAPVKGEPTIVKNFPNAFAKTDLHERLQALGRQNLIFIGFMTHMCVSSTVRAAFDLGYSSTVVGNATATRSLPVGGKGVVDAPELHKASLSALADLFAVVVNDAGDLPA